MQSESALVHFTCEESGHIVARGQRAQVVRHTRKNAMRALVFDGQLRLQTNYPEPALRPGEALIRPRLVGICNTDIEITRGYLNFRGVLGHEFVGTVVACEKAAWIGQRVVGEINTACGQCATCQRGDQKHCPDRTTMGIRKRDGAMADMFSLPVSLLHAVPAGIPDHAAVFAEPLAAAFEILEQTHIRPTARVAIVGDGKLGLLCAQVLRLAANDVTVIGRHPERWNMLRELGLHATAATGENAPEPRSFDLVIECSGNAGGLATARQLLRPRGTLVLKSTYSGESPIDLSAVVVDEIQILGSRCGPFAPALGALERKLILTEPLIAARFMLNQALEGFHAARGQLKVLLEV